MREIKLLNKDFFLREPVLGYYKKEVTKFGTGAKIDCSKDFIGKKVLVLILKK